MKLFNNDFKVAMKGYKALKTVCKSEFNRFVVGDGELILQSPDVELSVVVDCKNDDVIVLDDETLKLLEKCKNDDFEIDLDTIKAGSKAIKYKNELKALNYIDSSSYKEVATVTQAKLLEAIKGVKYAVAKDEVRPVLTNILWEDASLVCVDGYRIITKIVSSNVDMPILITSVAYTLLEKLLDAKSQDLVTVYLDLDHSDKRYISFTFGDWMLITRVGEGEFLNYKQVFTDDFEIIGTVDRKILLESLEFLKQDKNPLKLKVSNTHIKMTMVTVNNQLTDEIAIDTEVYKLKEPLEIAFNPKYLIESLKNIKDDIVKLEFVGSSLTPLVIEHIKGKDLILPVRING